MNGDTEHTPTAERHSHGDILESDLLAAVEDDVQVRGLGRGHVGSIHPLHQHRQLPLLALLITGLAVSHHLLGLRHVAALDSEVVGDEEVLAEGRVSVHERGRPGLEGLVHGQLKVLGLEFQLCARVVVIKLSFNGVKLVSLRFIGQVHNTKILCYTGGKGVVMYLSHTECVHDKLVIQSGVREG